MMRPLKLLDHVRVTSPCPEPWSAMHGDHRARHCDQCDLTVHNLSALTRDEAEALLAASRGRVCVRYRARSDGSPITLRCPSTAGPWRRGWALLVARAAAALGFVLGMAAGCIQGAPVVRFQGAVECKHDSRPGSEGAPPVRTFNPPPATQPNADAAVGRGTGGGIHRATAE